MLPVARAELRWVVSRSDLPLLPEADLATLIGGIRIALHRKQGAALTSVPIGF